MKYKKLLTFSLLIFGAAMLGITGCSLQYSGHGIQNNPSAAVDINPNQYPVASVSQSIDDDASESNQPDRSSTNETEAVETPLGIPAAEAKTSSISQKVAYLTFDDGPNTDYTERALDILRQKKVKASFMVVGKNVEINPAILQRMLSDGHAVINHTYSHDYSTIYSSPAAFINDLEKCNQVIMKYTGKPEHLFRAPGGPSNLGSNFLSALNNHGYVSIGWNVSAVDSDPRGITSKQIYTNIANDLQRVEKLKLTPIILMHDGTQLTTTTAKPGSSLAVYMQNREATLEALPAVIELFNSRGYTFAVVDEHTPPAWPTH